ncbi:MAG: HAD-IIB family hydrolase [Chloroflexota bacterium]
MGSRRILVSDIDGTLVGDDGALGRFAAWWAAHHDGHRLVYATGRQLPSVERLVATSDLPEPDAVISAVGTEIHDRHGRSWSGWTDRLADWDADAIRETLRIHSWLRPQEDEAQTPAKVSYDVPRLGADDLARVEGTLEASGFDSIVVYSQDLHLDILPAAAGKGNAAQFVAAGWGVAADDILAFGDSGNDIDLFRRGFHGTIVANAMPELASAVGPDVYRSPLAFADGVLDGIRHWSGARVPSA